MVIFSPFHETFSPICIMSIRSERNEEIYKKIQEDYKKSGKTIDYCCVKNGITTRTYYNIKKRLENTETSESSVKQKRTHKRKPVITDNTEIEFVTTQQADKKIEPLIKKRNSTRKMSRREGAEYVKNAMELFKNLD